uniref:C2H2-type domain-containing protein n=1 Tax=Hucho hucho TaxID=62062 RepID=A0A4W5RIW8_9TELE
MKDADVKCLVEVKVESQQYPPRETAGASTSHSHQMYSPQTGEICGEKFHLSEDLRRHRSLIHPKDMNKLPKRNLYPPGRSPYHCSLCGRDFNRMEHLKIHQRIHTGERPYACTVCNARFRHSWALTRHFRIHTGEKPYTCSQCGKTFRNCLHDRLMDGKTRSKKSTGDIHRGGNIYCYQIKFCHMH